MIGTASPLRQAAIYGAALAATKGLSFLMVPVYTHFLAPEDYGRLDILQTLANLLTIVAAMGLPETLYRFTAKAKDDAERRSVAANIAGLGVASAAVLLLAFHFLTGRICALLPGEVSEIQVRLMLFSIALTGCILVPMSYLRMENRAGLFFLASFGWVSFQVFLSVLALNYGMGVTGVMAACFVSHLVMSVILLAWQVRSTGIHLHSVQLSPCIRYGAPLILSGLAGFVLGSFDRWVLAGTSSAAEMATYALATKFGLATAMLVQPFEMWWLPRRLKVLEQPRGPERNAQTVSIGLLWISFSLISIATFGPVAIRLLTPVPYHGAAELVPWISALAALHAATTLFNTGCLAGHSTWNLVRIDVTAAIIALSGYLILIPEFAAAGAIAATAIALLLRLALIVSASQRLRPIPYKVERLSIIAVAALFALAPLVLSLPTTLHILSGSAGIILLAALGWSLEGHRLIRLRTTETA